MASVRRRWSHRPGGFQAVLGLILAGAPVLAGCGGAPVATQSLSHASTPLAATGSWFAAINDKNLRAAQDHFIPSAKDMMNWGDGDTSTWSTFTKLRCRTLFESGNAASVYCSFDESPSSSEGNPDSWWTVSLQRTTSGKWLINNYGQG